MRNRHLERSKKQLVSDENQSLTNDITRTLIEILGENIKLRSKLNAYTEAILLPTLSEKQAEFQQDYAEWTMEI